MRYIFLLLVSLIFYIAAHAGDGTYITGPQYVEPGTQQDYYVTFGTPLHNSTIVNWNVVGGQKISWGNGGCTVVWDNDKKVGYITVEEDLGGQSADLSVFVGITITPASSTTTYGLNYPGSIGLQGIDPAISTSYQWQSSTDNVNFSDIAGQQQNYIGPGILYTTTWYQCIITQNGQSFASDIAEVTIPELNPGTISIATQPSYGGTLSLQSTSGYGGSCSAITYSWEISLENGPWEVIGTGEPFPGLTTGVTANCRFRRKATCNTQTLFSNILAVSPQYLSPWYENLNYTRVNTILVPGIRSWMEADQLPTGKKTQSTAYIDGLGRNMQIVEKEATMALNTTTNVVDKIDVVQHYEYDNAGRSLKSFLVYPSINYTGFYKPDASYDQSGVLRTYYGEVSYAPTWVTTEVEESPLQRVKKTRMPGTYYGTNYSGTATDYAFNTADEVLIWNVGNTEATADHPYAGKNSSGNYICYGAGKLNKTVTTDPRLKKVIEFTDDAGRTILKKVRESDAAGTDEQGYTGWQFTYNVYDDYGRLRCIITPKAYKYLHDQNDYSLVNLPAVAAELCFWYVYDSRGRAIVKKTLGKAPEQVVYDPDDKPTFTQDGSLAASNQWLATVYDALDRPVTTGIITYAGTRQQLQQSVDDNYVANSFTSTTTGAPSAGKADLYLNAREASLTSYKASNTITFDDGFDTESSAEFTAEIVATGTVPGGSESLAYNASTLPSGHNLQVLTISYYDGYMTTAPAFRPAVAFPTTTVPYIQTFAKTQRTLGMATGGKVRILKGNTYSAADVFLATTTYYDEDGNAIQTHTDNPKNGTAVHSMQYDWMGKVTGTHESHTIAGTGYSNFVITNHYTFDALNRTTSLTKNVNGTAKKIYTLAYNIMGSVEKKTLAPDYHDPNNPQSSATAPYGIEQLKYTYNLHGGLTGINKDFALEQTTNGGQFKTTFGLFLGYDAQGGLFSSTRYDGKLAGAVWRTQGDNAVRRYNYAYDNLDRFTGADFDQKATPSGGGGAGLKQTWTIAWGASATTKTVTC